jgi:nitrogen PTS system EIIA component
MMRELLSVDSVMIGLDAENKKEALQKLAAQAADICHQTEHDIFDVVWEREKLGTTGVGQGIAIPHGKLAGLDKVYGFFARLKTPIEFEAIDDRPVDLLFMLLAPEGAGADHLKALAVVSKALRDPGLCQDLRKMTQEKMIVEKLAA